MDKRPGYVVAYAAGVCLAASLLLSLAAAGLRDRQERMREADRKFHVLKVFRAGVTDGAGRRLPAERLEALYETHVRELRFDRSGKPLEEGAAPEEGALPVFRWMEDGVATRSAIPVSGPGLWGPIHGYLALDGELEGILGVTFYRHQETPGLGGEIESDRFVKPFEGQRIRAPDGTLRAVEVAKGPVRDRDPAALRAVAVDGISGATLTGQGVSELMTRGLRTYEPVFSTLRQDSP